jgi:carboxypeptidase Taq
VNVNEVVTAYMKLNRRILDYEEAAAVMQWDLQTGAPEKAVHGRAGVIGTISTEAFRMFTSKDMEKYLVFLSNPDILQQLDTVTQVSVREDLRRFSRYIKIPPEKFEAYIILTTQAEAVWKEARQKGDFKLLQPYLEKIVEYLREAVELWGYEGHKYNTLLDEFEPGMTTVQLDELFSYLKEKLVNLLDRIKKSGCVPDNKMFLNSFDKDGQRQLSLKILDKMQFDFKRGRLDESAHPFTIRLNPGDVRITTRFDNDT